MAEEDPSERKKLIKELDRISKMKGYISLDRYLAKRFLKGK